MAEAIPALELRHATKRFGGVHALRDVNFSVGEGEVHALLGENGSGKSTLVKILTGYHTPDSDARLALWGRRTDLPVTAAQDHGVAVIHQDLGLVDSMSVLENLGITSSYGTRLLLPIRSARERALCRELLDQINLSVDPSGLVRDLSPAQRAGVAIARAIRALRNPDERRILIVDEPTTYLSADESARTLAIIRAFANRGSSVIFVTHRLQEALSVSDTITVLRDGAVADTFNAADADQQRIVRAMLGRDLERFYPERAESETSVVRVAVRGLHGEKLVNASFELRAGEVVGFAGLVGSGHDEVPYLLSGAQRPRGGSAVLEGTDLTRLALRECMKHGVVLVPGNRQRDGLWLAANARENITLPLLREFRRPWGLDLSRERIETKQLMTRLGVRPPTPERPANQFSGGNQQKIVLAKWLHRDPAVLLLDEPTQGIDAGAKHEVLELIVRLAQGGANVVICSGDYEQLANVCNRVLVVRYGRIAAELRGREITEDRITAEAQGGRHA